MATKKTSKPNGPADAPRKTIPIAAKSDDPEDISRTYAKHRVGGAFAALRVITAADKSAGYERDMDLPGLMAILREQGEAVSAGDLSQAEAMLMNQATALQSVFARLVERGMGCTEIAPFEANLRMGLRAQSQCRATLETLAAIKNPASVAFVRQANIAHGPQQVNNGTSAPSRARKNEIPPNELLEATDGERLDTGAASAASGGDQALATMGTLNRAEDRSG
jgi:hypothetical protein